MPSTRRTLATLTAAAAALVLAACAPGALDGDPTDSPAPSVEPTPTQVPDDPNPSDFEPAPSVPPTTDPIAGDLDIACSTVLTADQVYEFNAQMLATSQPTGGVPEGLAALGAQGGVVCAWQHVGSGDLLLVAVVPADVAIDGVDAGMPSASGVRGEYGIVVASPYFEGADADAQAMLDLVGGNLG